MTELAAAQTWALAFTWLRHNKCRRCLQVGSEWISQPSNSLHSTNLKLGSLAPRLILPTYLKHARAPVF